MADVETNSIRDWLRRNAKPDPWCPMCGTNDWAIGDEVQVTLRSGDYLPVHPLHCRECGLMMFVSSLAFLGAGKAVL